MNKPDWNGRLRHLAYAGGWKKFEPLWDWVIRARRVNNLLPVLERILQGFRPQSGQPQERVDLPTRDPGLTADRKL